MFYYLFMSNAKKTLKNTHLLVLFQVLDDFISMNLFPTSLLSGEASSREASPELDEDDEDDSMLETNDTLENLQLENGRTGQRLDIDVKRMTF